ncbi:MAG TPA: spore germination protein GerW family protein [Solirubrobacteraceae bacterium]|nr:spore germination protein GerW family protein [Solirubrobacteraceae bacterium]
MAKDGKRKGPRVGGLRGLLDGLVGARLCYGEPVTAGERTVIPVARVRVAGGGGYGAGDEGDGGGGGGYVEATPQGFIELGDAGAAYHPIPDPDQLGRTLRMAAGAAATLVAGVAAARRLRPGERRGLLPRGG